jgi:hypothetical protein
MEFDLLESACLVEFLDKHAEVEQGGEPAAEAALEEEQVTVIFEIRRDLTVSMNLRSSLIVTIRVSLISL